MSHVCFGHHPGGATEAAEAARIGTAAKRDVIDAKTVIGARGPRLPPAEMKTRSEAGVSVENKLE
jgi:hypothetical protein